tara:strand:+ start:219 stop:875 length:657 start_codon:yes stop_codon:yes gene_type:complete
MNRILITQRMAKDKYGEYIDYLENSYIDFFSNFNITPILLPNNIKNPIEYFLDLKCNKMILTGGDDIKELSILKHNNNLFKRDDNEKKLAKFALKRKIPIFCICRGFQIMNIVLGGNVSRNINNNNMRKHKVDLNKKYPNVVDNKTITVNSYHNHGITISGIAKPLEVLGTTKDGKYVEIYKHKSKPVFGVQWHPERKNFSKKFDNYIFKRFINNKEL